MMTVKCHECGVIGHVPFGENVPWRWQSRWVGYRLTETYFYCPEHIPNNEREVEDSSND